ncbi:hypothetical protein NDU88_006963 [Pleurodeles waltl]|uniref:Uncharacterized protein n=1 Tax=Pleurodeles waltl TaxID=8319 RepID=A0AAV7QNF9_PLEWA|nr:hypothetical protein NDU88_006963 [Pleurodeles waltl]
MKRGLRGLSQVRWAPPARDESHDISECAETEELPGDGNARRHRQGQRRMKAQEEDSLPAVTDREHRIQEQCSVLQRAAAFSNTERCTSPEAQGSHSSDGESSAVKWQSV